MENAAPQADPSAQLPRAMFYQLVHTLRRTLAPPVTDSPEDLIRRDSAAIAQVAALLPANADEADLAAKYVAAGSRAMECFRLAHKYHGSADLMLKFTAQAASMLRESRAARTMLMRVQAERQKRASDGAANEAAAATERTALELMARALADAPRTAEPAGEMRDVAAEADAYALLHRKRAALIRSLGRLPDRLDFGPLSPELVRQIVTGTSEVLRSLDAKPPGPRLWRRKEEIEPRMSTDGACAPSSALIPGLVGRDSWRLFHVMAGLGPAIHVFCLIRARKAVDGPPAPAMTRGAAHRF